MYRENLGLGPELIAAHSQSWQSIAQPGDYFSGKDRVAFVRCARAAADCTVCQQRKHALSPHHVAGEHEHDTHLDAVIVDLIHRLRSDPGRLTKAWFDRITTQISQAQYVEIVSVVASSVIIDTLHNALGLGLPTLPLPHRGRLHPKLNTEAVDAGAWVPVLGAADEVSDTGLPEVPNIVRALGLLPNAVGLFFNTFRPHYALKDIPLSISQSQAEFVAARVSAINECFY